MRLLDLFRKKEPVCISSNFKYNDANISDKQNPSKSVITSDHKYDMTEISQHEEQTIISVLSAAERKYTGDFASIGLANECYPIKYKARYVVFEVLIKRYCNSEKPLDKIAVSFANWSKGARHYSEAARLFEDAKDKVDWEKIHEFSSLGGFFSLFSEMYEKMHEYKKAIECVRLSLRYENPVKEYAKNRIKLLEEKQRNWKPYRPRKISEDQKEFERLVSLVAERYVEISRNEHQDCSR